MALMELDLKPSRWELKFFGLILFLFFGLIGGLSLWRSGSFRAPAVLWSIGTALAVVYYTLRPFRYPLYRGWMYVAYSIGWTVSLAILVTVYYAVVTPIGFIMRLCGHDTMMRGFKPEKRTYWVKHHTGGDPAAYLRQF